MKLIIWTLQTNAKMIEISVGQIIVMFYLQSEDNSVVRISIFTSSLKLVTGK